MMNVLYFTWDIGKEPGIDLGFFLVRYYSLMWVLAFVVGQMIMKKIMLKEKVSIEYLEPFLMYSIVGCMLGARIGHCVFYEWDDYYHNHILEIFLPFRAQEGATALFGLIKGYAFTGFAGLASHGAALGFVISTILFQRKYKQKDLFWWYDRLVISAMLGGALIRLGNFFNSEIVGKPWDGTFAVLFPHQNSGYGAIVPRHATQLYEAIGYVFLFLAMVFIYKKTDKKEFRGWIFGFFLVILFLIRFFIEFLKEPQSEVEGLAEKFGGFLNNGQLLSIPFIIVGIILMTRAKKITDK